MRFRLQQIVLFIFWLCLLPTVHSNAQTKSATIQGEVKDAATGKGIEFASVSFFNQADSVLVGGGITTTQGRFRILLQEGMYYGKIEFIGYESIAIPEVKVTSQARFIKLGEFTLTEKAEILSEIEITADRGETVYGIDKKVYNVGTDLSNLANNASDILDNLPSVQVDA
jgi:hypothetical protein